MGGGVAWAWVEHRVEHGVEGQRSVHGRTLGWVPPQDTAVLWIGAPLEVVPQLNSILWY